MVREPLDPHWAGRQPAAQAHAIGAALPGILIRPPYHTVEPRFPWPAGHEPALPFGTLLGFRVGTLDHDWSRLALAVADIRTHHPDVPVVLQLKSERSDKPLDLVAAVHHARRLASIAVRAILVEDEPVGPTLRAILPHPVNLAADVMEWLEVRRSAPPPECRALVRAIIQLAPRYRTLAAVLASLGRSEEAGRPRARSRCPIPPSHWFAASQALHAALALQADPDRPLFDAALDLGYSDASSLSRQMVRVFGLRPGVARSVLGWEPLLDRWLALEAGEPRLRPAWAASLDTPDDQLPPPRLARRDLPADRAAERGAAWTTEVSPRRAER